MASIMQCLYFSAGRCRSCSQMTRPYQQQLQGKAEHCAQLLAGHEQLRFLPPQPSVESGFRNKAKMVISGTSENPTIGILDADGHGVDLRHCGVCDPALRAAFPVIERFIRQLGLIPYDVPRRKGELKHVIITLAPSGQLMVRWVLRTKKHFVALRDSLPLFSKALPAAKVVSVNFLPEHKAVLEGSEEIVLSAAQTLPMELNGIGMHLRPQGFFQTNTPIAAALYRQAASWVRQLQPASVWDLYCGVGGFALHAAAPGRSVTGVETSAEAVRAAERSAADLGLADTRFIAGDATQFALAQDQAPQLVVVNPPRRGIGPTLADWLNASEVQHVIYSSCNAVSLAKDLRRMDRFTAVEARVMDMFPQTNHYEVIVRLQRRPRTADNS